MRARKRRQNSVLEGNGGKCIYTGRRASNVDHVPPRCLLAQPYPQNLVTVPCDHKFNSRLSLDEEYFAIILAHIGSHPALARDLVEGGKVDRALTNSARLEDRLSNQIEIADDGRVTINPEQARIDRVLRKLAAGLYYRKFDEAPGWRRFDALGLYDPENPPQHLADLSWSLDISEPAEVVQWSIFHFGFARAKPPLRSLVCSINFYNSIFAMIRCPLPKKRADDRQIALPFDNDARK